jgi:hypothetical protein
MGYLDGVPSYNRRTKFAPSGRGGSQMAFNEPDQVNVPGLNAGQLLGSMRQLRGDKELPAPEGGLPNPAFDNLSDTGSPTGGPGVGTIGPTDEALRNKANLVTALSMFASAFAPPQLPGMPGAMHALSNVAQGQAAADIEKGRRDRIAQSLGLRNDAELEGLKAGTLIRGEQARTEKTEADTAFTAGPHTQQVAASIKNIEENTKLLGAETAKKIQDTAQEKFKYVENPFAPGTFVQIPGTKAAEWLKDAMVGQQQLEDLAARTQKTLTEVVQMQDLVPFMGGYVPRTRLPEIAADIKKVGMHVSGQIEVARMHGANAIELYNMQNKPEVLAATALKGINDEFGKIKHTQQYVNGVLKPFQTEGPDPQVLAQSALPYVAALSQSKDPQFQLMGRTWITRLVRDKYIDGNTALDLMNGKLPPVGKVPAAPGAPTVAPGTAPVTPRPTIIPQGFQPVGPASRALTTPSDVIPGPPPGGSAGYLSGEASNVTPFSTGPFIRKNIPYPPKKNPLFDLNR